MLSFGTIVSLWNQYINVFNADIVNEDISQNRTESMQMSKRTLIHEDIGGLVLNEDIRSEKSN